MPESNLQRSVSLQGNSARSIIAEAILTKIGSSLFRAWSAGSQPKERNPHALTLLRGLWLRHLPLPLKVMG